MTIQEFLEQYNYAPFDDVELAEIATDVDGIIGETAEQFLQVKDKFDMLLNDIGYERG